MNHAAALDLAPPEGRRRRLAQYDGRRGPAVALAHDDALRLSMRFAR
jgi:hypothetical protein